MDKRYQVFVSSTFTDLKEERSRVIQTLMEMDCIPAGMEIFPAADEEQMKFIEKVIDDCDYYILIIGGRYGSVAPEGVSYTEKEYDYALKKGIKVIALLHENPDSIPVSKSDTDTEKVNKLKAFRTKASTGRLVKFWNDATQIPGIIALSLPKTIKTYPATGWVRANAISNAETLAEMATLQKRNAELEEEVRLLRSRETNRIPDIAGLDDTYSILGASYRYRAGETINSNWKIELTWREIFGLLAPHLLEPKNDDLARSTLGKLIFEKLNRGDTYDDLSDESYQTIKIQMIALGLIKLNMYNTKTGGRALFWELTEAGYRLMVSIRTIRKSGPSLPPSLQDEKAPPKPT
ncbi:DUF4062 domain-containing protein [Corallococcus sp. CA054B]|uniref:DUF4062 domain-containing protein n=1 Tax=Corallococcus sp. CA054B TaxID=2316734 RepID=UPI000EA1E242|nr:DUF4062 domain-containing protein [Corallococcus sp. CA054B]RKG68656.1 DUF4062 domain-containing protein [Corallococcus sp. CA054B]